MTLVGQLPRDRWVNKFGFNPAQLVTEQTIWTGSPGVYGYMPSAQSLLASSTNSLDATLGALTGNITGLNSAWDFEEQTFTMSGGLFAVIPGLWNRVFRSKILTVGANGKNVGEILIGVGSNATFIPNSIYMHIRSGDGQSQSAFATVPRSYTGNIKMVHYASGQSDDIECNMYARPTGGMFNIKDRTEIFRSSDDKDFAKLIFAPKTDIEMRAKRLSAGGNIGVSGTFELHLERTFRP